MSESQSPKAGERTREQIIRDFGKELREAALKPAIDMTQDDSPQRTQHTPGPWGVGDYIEPETRKRHFAVWGPNVILHEVGHPICLIAPKEKEDARDQANARLIATAPELLEACKEILKSTVVEGQELSMMPSCGAFALLRAAIAKAEAEGAQS